LVWREALDRRCRLAEAIEPPWALATVCQDPRVSRYRFAAEMWQAPGGSWHFVTVPFDVSDEIDETAPCARVAFGSVRVEATVGRTSWQTSVFPDRRVGAFVLPVKRAVRDAEALVAGDPLDVVLSVATNE
jgi:hypothetical protein